MNRKHCIAIITLINSGLLLILFIGAVYEKKYTPFHLASTGGEPSITRCIDLANKPQEEDTEEGRDESCLCAAREEEQSTLPSQKEWVGFELDGEGCYTVLEGEDLQEISRKIQVPLDTLLLLNEIEEEQTCHLQPGDKLYTK